MIIVEATLTDAHHHLGELLQEVKRGKVVEVYNATQQFVVCYMVPPDQTWPVPDDGEGGEIVLRAIWAKPE